MGDRRHVIQNEYTIQTRELWASLEDIRNRETGHGPLETAIPFLATILLFRWADQVDTEQKAIAAFDGHDYSPVLPLHQHWTTWNKLRGSNLIDFLRNELLPALGTAPNGMLGQTLRRLVPVVEQLVLESPATIDYAHTVGPEFRYRDFQRSAGCG